MKSKAIFICILSLLFASCKKDATVTPETPISESALFTKWFVTKTILTEKQTGQPDKVTTTPYNHTDFLILNNNRTAVQQSTINSIKTTQTLTFLYALTSQGKFDWLTLMYNNYTLSNWNITAITLTTLTISHAVYDGAGKKTGTYEIDYTNQ